MFKSIFKKLLVTYLLIIIVIIGVLSLILSAAYGQYVFNEKRKSLENAAFKINQLANELNSGTVSDEQLKGSLDSLGYVTDSKIYLVKLDKNSLASPETLKIGEDLEEKYLIEDLKKIMNGDTTFRKNQYSDKFDMYMVFTGVPWKDDKKIKGAILLFSPVNHISHIIAKMNLVIWLTGLFFILVSAVIIYFTSLRISRPIKKMERAAVKLAAGEETEDICIESRDEIGNLAATFNYMKQQLTNTEKMRRDFIANVSHDLRTPLTSIIGFVRGMLDGIVKPEEYNKYLLIIHDEAKRLAKLTSDILMLAKIQSEIVKIHKEILNVRNILESLEESTKLIVSDKSVSLSIDCDQRVSVYADKDRLKQILLNIISNSVKYGKEGGRITIKVEDKPDVTHFMLEDDGIGIAKEELPFIFEKFYRVDKSRKDTQNSTGLGLNIVKSLVELHGGKIWAESEIGKGTCIYFDLPKK